MKTLYAIYFLFVINILLISCEGPIGVNGHVISAETSLPLNDVKIILYKEQEIIDTIYSDSSGYFEGLRYTSCQNGCPNSQMKFIKFGYDTLTLFLDIKIHGDSSINTNDYIVEMEAQ